MDVLTIDAFDVINLTKRPGGQAFTQFVDACIRAEAFNANVADSNMHTTVKTNIGDGGVDTRVEIGLPADRTGYFSVPSIWQYKATDRLSAWKGIAGEVKKRRAKERVLAGDAYRLCICDDLTDDEVATYEKKIDTEIRKYTTPLVEPKVVGASQLAVWANRYPALIIEYFKPSLFELALHMGAWSRNAEAVTPTFIESPQAKPIIAKVAEHVNFSSKVPNAVLAVQGLAGAGKSRAVFEGLRRLSGAETRVLYTNGGENAMKVATMVVNEPSRSAIIVADECLVRHRVSLSDLLAGYRDRVRVIAIDNSGERPPSEAGELWLEVMDEQTCDNVLASNFPYVPAERRRAYRELAGGFIRLAADLCVNDGKIMEGGGHVTPAIPGVRAYLRGRLDDKELRIVEAIALVRRIGYQDEIESELQALCTLTDNTVADVKQVSERLHDAPGFVARAGRYLYITPEIIAEAAFDGAWQRWASKDPEGFLSRIPAELEAEFVERVKRSASLEVREAVASFFLQVATAFEPDDLASLEKVDRFIPLIDTDPALYFPILQSVIERATNEQLQNVSGASDNGRWGPRRGLVWLVERLAQFPEFFQGAEFVLRRLALTENEQDIGNNATAQWRQLFRIVLSGTPVPFRERLELLRSYLLAEDTALRALALTAINDVLSTYHYKTVGPSIVGGRIAPPDWRPATLAELKECQDDAVSMIVGVADHSDEMRHNIITVLIDHVRGLLAQGYLDQVEQIFTLETLNEPQIIQLQEEVAEFLHFDVNQLIAQGKGDYVERVTKWLETVRLPGIHGDVVAIVGNPWHANTVERDPQWEIEIHTLAERLVTQPEDLIKELPWLCSGEAKSAWNLGVEIGKQPTSAGLLAPIINEAISSEYSGFAAGYLFGLSQSPDENALVIVNQAIDDAERRSPLVAFNLARTVGGVANPLERALRLFDQGLLPIDVMAAFQFGVDGNGLSTTEIRQILNRLAIAYKSGNQTTIRLGIDIVSRYFAKAPADEALVNLGEDAETVWNLLEGAADGVPGSHEYWWEDVLKRLAHVDADRVAKIGFEALLSDSFQLHSSAANVLIETATANPAAVIQALNEAMDNTSYRWRFYLERLDDLVRLLPIEQLKEWLKVTDIEKVRMFARHLPSPHLASDGTSVVPELTAYVLGTFEDDDRVFEEFITGTHSFQLYSGDIAAQHEAEAAMAKRFLSHPLKRIREWAAYEATSAKKNALREKQEAEENRF